MGGLKSFTNFGVGTLASGITSIQTSLTVGSGEGALFPNPTGAVNGFYFTIYDTAYASPDLDPNKEICLCTARSTDSFSTIARAQQGTTAVAHNTADHTYKVIRTLTLADIQELASGLGAYGGADTGAANAYVVSVSPYISVLTEGIEIAFKPANTNTTASTLNVNGFGAINLYDRNGSALIAGLVASGNLVTARYDGTNWRLTSATDKGSYAIGVWAPEQSTFTDAQTVYFGNKSKGPQTTANQCRVYVNKTGTIKAAHLDLYVTTAGTNESWVIYIRLNNTTDTAIATVAAATNNRLWASTALSIAVVAGDYFEIKSIQPTWATNPANGWFSGSVYIETAL